MHIWTHKSLRRIKVLITNWIVIVSSPLRNVNRKISKLLQCNRCETACQILVQIHSHTHAHAQRKLSNQTVALFSSNDYNSYLRLAVVPFQARVCHFFRVVFSWYFINVECFFICTQLRGDAFRMTFWTLSCTFKSTQRRQIKNILILSRFIWVVNVCMQHTQIIALFLLICIFKMMIVLRVLFVFRIISDLCDSFRCYCYMERILKLFIVLFLCLNENWIQKKCWHCSHVCVCVSTHATGLDVWECVTFRFYVRFVDSQ